MSALGEGPDTCIAIGDGVEDLLAARAAPIPFVLVRTGRGEETLRHPACRRYPPFLVARDLEEAVPALCARFFDRREAAA
jgi:phosphoglycolate phosphatase-like HAD superfamily hydrolase